MNRIALLLVAAGTLATEVRADVWTVTHGKNMVPLPANDSGAKDGECTFGEALQNINLGVDVYVDCKRQKTDIPAHPVIMFEAGVQKVLMLGQDVSKSNAPFVVSGLVPRLTIRGPIIFDGEGRTRAFVWGGQTVVEFIDVTIQNAVAYYDKGKISGSGGAILVNSGSGGLIMRNSSIEDSRAVNGGAIEMGGDLLELYDTALDGNKALGTASANTGQGGAIRGCGLKDVVKNSVFLDNAATNTAGAWYCPDSGAEITIQNVLFEGNTVTEALTLQAGGGAIVSAALTKISGSRFVDNVAVGPGGALQVPFSGSGIYVRKSTFRSNESKGVGAGGGAISLASIAQIEQSYFAMNSVAGDAMTPGAGGAIEQLNGPMSITNSTFNENSVYDDLGSGSAIYTTSDDGYDVIHNTFVQGDGPATFHSDANANSNLISNIFHGYSAACAGTFNSANAVANIEFPVQSCKNAQVVDSMLKGPEIYKHAGSGLVPLWIKFTGSRYFAAQATEVTSAQGPSSHCFAFPVSGKDQNDVARAKCTPGAHEAN